MSHTPPPPKPPVYKTYAERAAAEKKIRDESNRKTHQEYRLLPVPAPGKTRRHDPKDPVPSAGGIPTRDMEPIKLPLRKREDRGKFADIISINRKEGRGDGQQD